jgi:hypothetical protein
MISIFPLWTFHLYVATFQQHLHMEYMSLSWYDIPELLVPIRIAHRGLLLTRKQLNQGFLWVKLKSSLRKFYGRHHDMVDRYGISVTNDHGYVPLVVNTFRSFPHSWLITRFVTRLTRSLGLCVCFVIRCLSFWPLYCLFFDIWILITPLLSPNYSSNTLQAIVSTQTPVFFTNLSVNTSFSSLQATVSKQTSIFTSYSVNTNSSSLQATVSTQTPVFITSLSVNTNSSSLQATVST